MSSRVEGALKRQGHVVLDLGSRRWKALKIEKLLGLDDSLDPVRMLEVGTGSGGIANYFGAHPSGRFQVDAVDVEDSRLVTEGYQFSLVRNTSLPFPDASFDVVLSNHVIEHVGDHHQQRQHLLELGRVLKPGGRGYLAVPNRWMLVEPHYRLAFLSWLPRSLRNAYLKFWRGAAEYDCEPLEVGELEEQFRATGLDFRNRGIEALRLTLEIERADSWLTKALRAFPDGGFAPFRRMLPTLIYTFSHGRPSEQS